MPYPGAGFVSQFLFSGCEKLFRGNTQGKVPDVDAEGRMSSRGDDRRGHSWKEASEQDQTGADEEPAKRRWEKSGMAWMKKNDWNQREPSYEETGDELGNAKRRWEKFLTREQRMVSVQECCGTASLSKRL